MRRKARLLKEKAVNSLLLSIEQFNKPFDTGRVEAVLILLDHALEMLLKAAIVERGGKIHQKGVAQTIGFDKCLRIGLNTEGVRFLTEEQVIALQSINSLRDAAQHYLLDVSEEQLYLQAQTGITVFKAVLKGVFSINILDVLPPRVLPISTIPPQEIEALYCNEIDSIKQLLAPGKRKRTEALSRLRPLAIMDRSIRGESIQPSNAELNRIANRISDEEAWDSIFTGVSSFNFTTRGYGPDFEIHWTKKEGIPIHAVPEGTPGAPVVATKRVNELDFYNMCLTQLKEHLGLNQPRCLALIWHLDIQSDDDCFKEIVIGKTRHKRYSQKALKKLQSELPNLDVGGIWEQYCQHQLAQKKAKYP